MRNLLQSTNHFFSLVLLALAVSVLCNNEALLVGGQAGYLLGLGKRLLDTAASLPASKNNSDVSWILGLGDITGYGYAPRWLV